MGTSGTSPVDVSRPTSQGELDRLERKVTRNSYIFLLIGLLYAVSCGLELIAVEGSKPPREGRNWLMADATWLKGGVFLMCFFLARLRPHALGFGIGLLFIVAWLVGAVWVDWHTATAGIGWFVIAFLFFSGLFTYLTARKYDRALQERDARGSADAATSAP